MGSINLREMYESVSIKKQNITCIESLPDDIIIHILCFLKPYQAVKTSLISKRWKDLWKFVPCLNLYDIDFDSDEAFETFVSRVLLYRKTKQLDTFELVWNCFEHETCVIERLNKWLHYVNECRPRDLTVMIDGLENGAWFPSYLLSCTTLEDLILEVDISKRFEIHPNMVNLPILKTLSLSNVVIPAGVISTCPLLEELYICDCSFRMPEITSLKLKFLSICGSYTTTLKISAPSLVYLSCSAPLGLVSLENMPCLNRANIKLPIVDFGGNYDRTNFKMLPSLANSVELRFEGNGFKKMMEKEAQNCGIFRNIKRLRFDRISVCRDMRPISCLLRLTPNIENLLLVDTKLCTPEGAEEAAQVIQCCSLKTITIEGPRKHQGEYHELAKVVQKHIKTSERTCVTIELRTDYSKFPPAPSLVYNVLDDMDINIG